MGADRALVHGVGLDPKVAGIAELRLRTGVKAPGPRWFAARWCVQVVSCERPWRFPLNSVAWSTHNPVLGALGQQVALQALPRPRAHRGEAPAAGGLGFGAS